jgi:hypothetical protein
MCLPVIYLHCMNAQQIIRPTIVRSRVKVPVYVRPMTLLQALPAEWLKDASKACAVAETQGHRRVDIRLMFHQSSPISPACCSSAARRCA